MLGQAKNKVHTLNNTEYYELETTWWAGDGELHRLCFAKEVCEGSTCTSRKTALSINIILQSGQTIL